VLAPHSLQQQATTSQYYTGREMELRESISSGLTSPTSRGTPPSSLLPPSWASDSTVATAQKSAGWLGLGSILG